jgi:integrase
MSCAFIITRPTSTGARRYVVKYKLGGREATAKTAGTFKTRREAEARREWVLLEMAAMRVPDVRVLHPKPRRRLEDECRRWRESRLDHAESTRAAMAHHQTRIVWGLGADTDPASITVADVQGFVAALAVDLKARTVQLYLATLKQVLDHAEVVPNPARDRRVRVPRVVAEEPVPPSWREVELLLAAIPDRYRLLVRVLEATGLRVGEALAATWGDLDAGASRLRVSRVRTKTAAGRRWAQLPEPLLEGLLAGTPPDDRSPDRRLFAGLNQDNFRGAMARACQRAGIPVYSAHDLRHRRISVWFQEGVPLIDIARRAGHARASLSADVYGHVVPAD